jgi:hypothetical protein
MIALVGCGSSSGDSTPAAQQGTPNKQAATSATQATIGAVQTALKPAPGGGSSGQGSATQFSSAAQSTQQLITPAAGTATKSLELSGLKLADLLRPLGNPTGSTGTCDCTADTCTFQACSNGYLVIDGKYSWAGGHIVATGLKYTVAVATGGANANIVINVDMDITATATSMNGTFHTKGNSTTSAGGATYTSDWDTTIDFKSVTFPSGGGAPSGGSEHVSGKVSSTANGTTQAFSSDYDVAFPGG